MKEKRTTKDKLMSAGKIDKHVLWLAIVALVMFAVIALVNPKVFLSTPNFKSMGFQLAELGFFSIAMMIPFMSGGIDLSVVSIANLSGVVAGFIFAAVGNSGNVGQIGWIIALTYVIAIAIGFATGFFNGFLISKFKIPALLITLGSMDLFAGAAYILTKSKAVVGFPEAVSDFGSLSFGPVSLPFLMLIVLIAITAVIMNKTRFGFELKFLGTNPIASKFAGIKNNKIIIKTYMYSAVVSAIAGVMMVMKVNSAKVGYGESYMFTAILCVILGGVSPVGGAGKITGVVLALLCLQFLTTGFNILAVNAVYKDFIWGLLLLSVMSLKFFSDKRQLMRK